MPEQESPILDAHIHLWDTSRFELPWLANLPRLARRYSAFDLDAAIGELPVTGTVAVQAGDSVEEAEWLFDATAMPARTPSRVVLQYAPAVGSPLGSVQSAVDGRGVSPAGVRLPVHGRRADWTDLEGLATLIDVVVDRGMVLELLLRPDQLAVIPAIAAAHPGLQIVLCHLGLGSHEPTRDWQRALAALAGIRSVAAKISGLFSPRGQRSDVDGAARSAVAAAFDTLGPDRLMFGSDWPMSTLAGDYAQIVDRTATALPVLTTAESAAIWGRNADRIYPLASER